MMQLRLQVDQVPLSGKRFRRKNETVEHGPAPRCLPAAVNVITIEYMCARAVRQPDLAILIAAVPTPKFGSLLRAYVSQAGPIRNLGGFYWRSVKKADAVLSIWNGEISDYRLRKSSDAIFDSPDVFAEMQKRVERSREGEHPVNLLRPPKDDPRRSIIDRLGIRERLSVVTRDQDTAIFTFYLRSERDGHVTEEQFMQYRELLPVAHELIALRHKIVGSEAFQFEPGTNVSTLKERGIPPFDTLSKREVQVCDSLVRGQSAEGTALELGLSVTTVRTLRRRSYQKLGVNSATQLTALVINDGLVLRA
ncbi:MAG: helix-turn-helix transcriptional regulator [Gammaproteobacteria bacterium]|nr:helix-turn-helix transcriptional regulator [Gammaproteobacteria bacterium]MBT8455961.1 helix-turn-helix transcriptional regulator [Alphaproteobacteria bacterium]MBT8477033.1 helix-turn-helix transcriptional regulator [Alphaproteobacteria bacterium]